MAKGKYEYWLTSEGLTLLEGWARDGLTDKQISANIGISRSTLNAWKVQYPDISDTLKKGKEVVDRQVENALLTVSYTHLDVYKRQGSTEVRGKNLDGMGMDSKKEASGN